MSFHVRMRDGTLIEVKGTPLSDMFPAKKDQDEDQDEDQEDQDQDQEQEESKSAAKIPCIKWSKANPKACRYGKNCIFQHGTQDKRKICTLCQEVRTSYPVCKDCHKDVRAYPDMFFQCQRCRHWREKKKQLELCVPCGDTIDKCITKGCSGNAVKGKSCAACQSCHSSYTGHRCRYCNTFLKPGTYCLCRDDGWVTEE